VQSRPKAALLLVLAVALGGALGSVTTAELLTHGPGLYSGHGSEWYVDLLTHELKLSSVQQDSVRAILRRHRGGLDSLYAEMTPQMDRIREAIRADVRTQLTPEQQSRYAEVTARLDAHRREEMRQDSINR